MRSNMKRLVVTGSLLLIALIGMACPDVQMKITAAVQSMNKSSDMLTAMECKNGSLSYASAGAVTEKKNG